jgi:hypothetical protein
VSGNSFGNSAYGTLRLHRYFSSQIIGQNLGRIEFQGRDCSFSTRKSPLQKLFQLSVNENLGVAFEILLNPYKIHVDILSEFRRAFVL